MKIVITDTQMELLSFEIQILSLWTKIFYIILLLAVEATTYMKCLAMLR